MIRRKSASDGKDDRLSHYLTLLKMVFFVDYSFVKTRSKETVSLDIQMTKIGDFFLGRQVLLYVKFLFLWFLIEVFGLTNVRITSLSRINCSLCFSPRKW